MNTLITGGAGFIGSHLADALLAQGHSVTILDNLSSGKKENVPPALRGSGAFLADLARPQITTKTHFKDQDVVFHLAAQPRIQPSIKDPAGTSANNLLALTNALLYSVEYGVERFVFTSSSSVYGEANPLPLKEHPVFPDLRSDYARSKWIGEELCHQFVAHYNLDVGIIRYFNVYGPRTPETGPYATVVSIFLKQWAVGEPLTIVGDGEQRRDFTWIDDAVKATVGLGLYQGALYGDVFNVGSDTNHSINQIAELVGGPTVHAPERRGEYRETLADTTKINQLLGWKAEVSLEQGIEQMRPDFLKSD